MRRCKEIYRVEAVCQIRIHRVLLCEDVGLLDHQATHTVPYEHKLGAAIAEERRGYQFA